MDDSFGCVDKIIGFIPVDKICGFLIIESDVCKKMGKNCLVVRREQLVGSQLLSPEIIT